MLIDYLLMNDTSYIFIIKNDVFHQLKHNSLPKLIKSWSKKEQNSKRIPSLWFFVKYSCTVSQSCCPTNNNLLKIVDDILQYLYYSQHAFETVNVNMYTTSVMHVAVFQVVVTVYYILSVHLAIYKLKVNINYRLIASK